MEAGNICLECGNDFDEFNHIVGLVQCLKCPYQTTCLPSVVNHAAYCNLSASLSKDHPVAKLNEEMHCKCGFSSFDGYALARHLLVCDRGSGVYSSHEAAQANVIKRSMLDMLGLIRRDEDEEVGEEEGEDLGDSPQSHMQETAQIESRDGGQDERMSQIDSSNHQRMKMQGNKGENAAGGESGTSGVSYDPAQSLYNIAGASSEQEFNTQLSLDDLGPPSVLPAQGTDWTPQLKDDYQSLATPRVPDQSD